MAEMKNKLGKYKEKYTAKRISTSSLNLGLQSSLLIQKPTNLGFYRSMKNNITLCNTWFVDKTTIAMLCRTSSSHYFSFTFPISDSRLKKSFNCQLFQFQTRYKASSLSHTCSFRYIHVLMVWKRVYYNNPIQRLTQTTLYSVFLGKYNNDISEINLDQFKSQMEIVNSNCDIPSTHLSYDYNCEQIVLIVLKVIISKHYISFSLS